MYRIKEENMGVYLVRVVRTTWGSKHYHWDADPAKAQTWSSLRAAQVFRGKNPMMASGHRVYIVDDGGKRVGS